MSRGPGRWQSYLLQKSSQLSGRQVLIIQTAAEDMVQRIPSRAELVAARRAAWRLAEMGKVRTIYLGKCQECEQLYDDLQCAQCNRRCRRVLAITSDPTIQGV